MWAFSEKTALPVQFNIPTSHILVLDEFFRITDAMVDEPDASKQLKDLFTHNGIWKTPSATYSGLEELAKVGHTWTGLKTRKSMRHWVLKVYAHDVAGCELMLLGRIRIENLDGDVRDANFGARVVIANETAPNNSKEDVAKIDFFQGWSSGQ